MESKPQKQRFQKCSQSINYAVIILLFCVVSLLLFSIIIIKKNKTSSTFLSPLIKRLVRPGATPNACRLALLQLQHSVKTPNKLQSLDSPAASILQLQDAPLDDIIDEPLSGSSILFYFFFLRSERDSLMWANNDITAIWLWRDLTGRPVFLLRE